MKNKLFLAGMFGMALAFMVAAIGCDTGDDGGGSSPVPDNSVMFDVRNKSSVIVTVTFNGTVNKTLPVDDNWKTTVELSGPLTSVFFTPQTVRYVTDASGDITFWDN
jgi:hypothetical protein